MNKMNGLLTALLGLTIFTNCETNDDDQPEIILDAVTVENIHAPNDMIDRVTGEVTEVRPFRYFSLEKNALVESQGGNWDVGFKGTTIIVNSGTSGSGNARAAVVSGIFDELDEVPASASFVSDGSGGMAIPTGSGNGWYNYNSSTRVISPIPGRILLFKTNGGNYAKVEILSYYQNNPPLAEVSSATTPGAFYTFRYVLQPDGSKNF